MAVRVVVMPLRHPRAGPRDGGASTLAAVSGSGPRMASLVWNAGPELLLSATLAAVPGLGPRVAAGGRTAGPGLLRFYVTLARPAAPGPYPGVAEGHHHHTHGHRRTLTHSPTGSRYIA